MPELTSHEHRVALLQNRLNNVYTFNNKTLAIQALQTSGPQKLPAGALPDLSNNKYLAISGDILLDWHLCRQWMQTGTSREEWSTRRSQIASNKNLNRIGRERGLDACAIRKVDEIHPMSVHNMATTVEALLAAVFLDAEDTTTGSGMDSVSKVASELGLDFGD